ncbi:MAG: DUF3794 domain-containing protein [Christensenellaceae bacterium]|jgi:hypothetical protein|nr:DUF3794 domain-containing protein [Christensenellaceae bacterium]
MILRGDKRQLIKPMQFYVDKEIFLSGAERIISVMAQARIVSLDVGSEETKICYSVCYNIVYRNANDILSHTETQDKSTSIKIAEAHAKNYVDLNAQVIAVEYVGSTDLKIRTEIELRGFVIIDHKLELPEITNDVYTKNESYIIERVEPIKESEIVASGAFTVKENINKILSYDTQIQISKTQASTEICEISGECFTYIIYLSNGNINSRCFTIPFTTEILASNMKENTSAYCNAIANSTVITLDNESSDATSNVNIEIVVLVKGIGIQKDNVEFCCDAYSSTDELEIKYNTSRITENICLTGASEKIYSMIRLEKEHSRLRSVLAICPPMVGAIRISNENGLAVEGIISMLIICLDENDEITTELAEVPYNFVVDKDFPIANILTASTLVNSIVAKVRHNDEIEITGELCIDVHASYERTIEHISSISKIRDRSETEYAISLYLVRKGESLWDVAKALHTDETTLLDLNSDIKLPLNGGEEILLYRELNTNT